jgi:general secretion pathway protein K
MQSSSELRRIKDLDALLYNALVPYITALPEPTAVNINTASKKVLKAMAPGASDEKINEVLQARSENGINSINELNKILDKINVAKEQITIDSQYFLNIAFASSKDFKLVVYTLIKRKRNPNNTISVSIIRQSFNEW